MKANILVTDDDQVSCQLFAEVLEDEGYRADQAHSGEETLLRLREETYDLLVTDVRMPGMSGLDLTRTVRATQPDLPIIVMTAFGSLETAIEAIQDGAFDYASKPLNLEEFKQTVSRALAQQQLKARPEGQREEALTETEPLGTIIGRSPAMIEVYKTIARAAPTKSTILILGESGTGKELISRAIHQHSARATCPFVAVDCGALTETLLESELFGHVRGAFTGAVADKKGVFEEAEGGTCFLDEIGDISANMQAKLLRVLQENEIRRVGGQNWTKVNVRVIAATNKNLTGLVKTDMFREDLFYRLNVVTIKLPPLRERTEDIPTLAHAFLRRYSRENGKSVTMISDHALDLLTQYSWPGNIRELENTIERAVALSSQSILGLEDLSAEVQRGKAAPSEDEAEQEAAGLFSGTPTLEEVKKRYIIKIVQDTEGNLSHAAEILDIDRRSLYRMLDRYQITPPRKEE